LVPKKKKKAPINEYKKGWFLGDRGIGDGIYQNEKTGVKTGEHKTKLNGSQERTKIRKKGGGRRGKPKEEG